jgi:hypothetical protein
MERLRAGMFSLSVFVSLMAAAQKDTATQSKANPLSFTGYAELYYSYDFHQPASNTRPSFLYNFNRHHEVNLNLAFVKAAYNKERVRANLAFAAGTYINANYAAEPATLKHVFEANIGYQLTRKGNWWLDLGIMPSHIGFESAVGKDNWTLTRSMVAENSPYFESGAKLSYTSANEKLMVAALLLNGWQRITRLEGNSLLSYGTQLFFKPSGKVTLNYSTFIGTDKPDSARRWRYYHNLYSIFQFSPHWAFTAGFDVGMEEKAAAGSGVNTWYSPVGILRYMPSANWAFAFRGEYYSDANGVIIVTGTPNGFKTTGLSFNIDFLPQSNVVLRVEGRRLSSTDAIFKKANTAKTRNYAFACAAAISF